MERCVSHLTAFNWLLSTSKASLVQAAPKRRAPMTLPPAAELAPLITDFGQLPVHAYSNAVDGLQPVDLLVGKQAARHEVANVNVHLCERLLPSGALLELGDDLLICSPELVFVQLAAMLDLVGAIAAGFALCSSYRLEPKAEAGLVCRLDYAGDGPLTTVKRLESFLRKCKGMRGVAKAQEALRYVREGSRSPRESSLAMLFGLPVALGGFELGQIYLNRPIKGTTRPDSGWNRCSVRIPDLTVESIGRDGVQRKLRIEYNPYSTHGGSKRAASDSVRRNELVAQGDLGCLEVTDVQARDFVALSRVAEQARVLLKRRKLPRIRGVDECCKQKILCETWARQVTLWKRLFVQGEPQMRASLSAKTSSG